MTVANLCNLFPAMLPKLWAFALRLSRDRHDAEDLVRQACVCAVERAHQLQPDTPPLSWMFSIVHALWIDEIRDRKTRSRWGENWNHGFVDTAADVSIPSPAQDQPSMEIVRAVQQLPDTQRVVMLLVAVEGLSYEEAAKVLDVPVDTITNRLSRARQAIGSVFSERRSGMAEERNQSWA